MTRYLNIRTNNALVQTFKVNNLHELAMASRSGTVTASGTTSNGATNVTVNGTTASLYGDSTFAGQGLSLVPPGGFMMCATEATSLAQVKAWISLLFSWEYADITDAPLTYSVKQACEKFQRPSYIQLKHYLMHATAPRGLTFYMPTFPVLY